jgi:hypothetical protein
MFYRRRYANSAKANHIGASHCTVVVMRLHQVWPVESSGKSIQKLSTTVLEAKRIQCKILVFHREMTPDVGLNRRHCYRALPIWPLRWRAGL